MENLTKITNKLKYQDYFLLPNFSNSNSTYIFYCIALFQSTIKLAKLQDNYIDMNSNSIEYDNQLPLLTLEKFQELYNLFENKHFCNFPSDPSELVFFQYFDMLRKRNEFALIETEEKPNHIKKYWFHFDTGFFPAPTGENLFSTKFMLVSWCYYSDLYNFILELKK